MKNERKNKEERKKLSDVYSDRCCCSINCDRLGSVKVEVSVSDHDNIVSSVIDWDCDVSSSGVFEEVLIEAVLH